ncbi:MAG TPA: pitrilysin family protein [Pyrinomonadaceae bacterium]|nr:pitrilysin family protein [Pyrinomonadaceae bacterium]
MTKAIQQTAPEPLAPVAFQIPKPFETTLPNGLRVVIIDDERLPLVSYRLAFFSGDAHDPKDHTGLTSAMVANLTEGTENYSSRELAEKIERLGASLGASSSDDFTIISASALTMYSADILDLLAEVVFQPTFPEEELDLYRRNTIENLKFQRSQANFLANEQTARILYGQHPYATLSPAPSDVEKLTREDLVKLHAKRILPNNAVFVAVGDVDRDELLGKIEQHFGTWEKGEIHTTEHTALPQRTKRTITIVDRPGSAQANIVLSNLSVDRNHPDYFPLIVMNQVLGAGASSRVFMNLREEKGYTYGAYTRLDLKKLAGEFEATAEVRTPVTGDSLKEFFYELERIRNESVTDDELADAKNYLTGVFPIRAETQEGLTGLIVNQQLYDLPSDYLQTYRDNVDAITAEDVQRVANEQIHPDMISIVIVGDAGDVLPQVSEYAETIEIFDTDGKKKELSAYDKDESGEPVNIAGTWNLSLDFQGQAVPVTLTLEQDGASINGKLETMLGNGEIADGKVEGSKFSGTAVTEMQGQSLELAISGKADGDSISGSLSAPIIPEPLTFTGSRSS